MRVEIARLHEELGATMIYVTHDQVEAMTLADKIVVLRDGHIEQVGVPMDLYDDPDNKFVAGFIGSPSMNFIDGKIKKGQLVIPALRDNTIKISTTSLEEGTEVIVGVRPQDVVLKSGDLLYVKMSEQLGGVTYEYLEAPNGEQIVAEVRAKPSTKGQSVGATFDAKSVYLFDKNTEKRIRI